MSDENKSPVVEYRQYVPPTETVTITEKPKPAKPEKEVTVLFVGESKEGLFLKEKESKQVRIAPHGTKINRVHPMKIKENLFIKWSLK